MDEYPFDNVYEISEFEDPLGEGKWWDELANFFIFRASSSPRKEASTTGTGKNAPATSFDDFQESVNDAWDLGDDEFCVISGNSIRFCLSAS